MSVMICTHHYAAQETIAEDTDQVHAYGAGVYIWPCGCIVLELLTGDLFTRGTTLLEILAW